MRNIHKYIQIFEYSLHSGKNNKTWDQKIITDEEACKGSIVSVLGREEGYTFKYTLSPEGVPEGEARGNS